MDQRRAVYRPDLDSRSPWTKERGQVTNSEAKNGRVTILVSHRFSTVRMADLIVVLDGSRVAEVGSHEDLVAKGGKYAELYGIRASAYR